MEREIDHVVDLCLPNGKLNPRAIGWSRYPQHRDNLTGWGGNKRFDYRAWRGTVLRGRIAHSGEGLAPTPDQHCR